MDEVTTGTQVTTGDSGATGVDVAGAADQQVTGGSEQATDVKWVGEEDNLAPETGVEETGAADHGTGQSGQDQNTSPEDKQEVAFAKRLAAERDKIRDEVSRDLGQQIHRQIFQQYAPIFELALEEAQRHGMDPVEWARQARLNRESAFNRRLEELGIDKSIIDNHPDVIRARQALQQFNARQESESAQSVIRREAELFAEAFPNVKVENIQPEVFELRQKKGISLAEAYFRVNYKTLAEQAKAKGEQTAIASIRGRESAATGPATGGATPTQKTAWDYSKEDFEQLIERARAGELRKR